VFLSDGVERAKLVRPQRTEEIRAALDAIDSQGE